VSEKCARFQSTHEQSLLAEEFHNCVKAGAPIDSDGRGHLSCWVERDVVCKDPSLSVAGKIRGV
jgi:hypothetical protein